MIKDFLKSKARLFVSFAFGLLLSFSILTAGFSTPVAAFNQDLSNYPVLDSVANNLLDPQSGDVYVAFQMSINIPQVEQEDVFSFFTELTNDEQWYSGDAEVTVVNEGFGQSQIFRQWQQDYDYAGVPTSDLTTRLWIDYPNVHLTHTKGGIADYVIYYTWEDDGQGGVIWTHNAIWKPNIEIPQEFLVGFMELQPVTFATDLSAYYGTTVTADIEYEITVVE
jgi:hypothetical protein